MEMRASSMEGKTRLRRGRLVFRGGGSSTEGRLVYRGRDSFTEGKTSLWRGRLVYGGGDSSAEWETRLRRGRLVYKGGGSSRDYTKCYTVCAEYMYMNIFTYVHIDIYNYI
jgi:hypothetical protein